MSLEAMLWALYDAPDVPKELVSVLTALGERADKDGTAAYPGLKLLARMTRKTERQVRYDMRELTKLGLIREGDQSKASRLPVNRRPTVYDLAMERGASERDLTGEWPSSGRASAGVPGGQPIAGPGGQPTARQPTAGQPTAGQPTAGQPTAPQSGPDLGIHPGGQPTAPQVSDLLGGNAASSGGQPIAANTSLRQQNSPTESSAKGGVGGDARTLFGEDPPARRRAASASAAEHPRFAEWYAAYPVRKARGAAVTAYGNAVRAGADPEALLAAAQRYQRDRDVQRGYGKHPATWLRAQCWLDEDPPPASPGDAPPKTVNYSDEEYASGW